MEQINPRVDIVFKKIFGVEENKDLLISLINAVVSTQDQIGDLTILNPYNPKNFRSDKLSILDIKASSISGKRYNIEIQITDEADYDKRALYYWGKLYTEQLKVSEDYALLNKAISIHILNFHSIPKVEKYHNVFHIAEKERGIPYFEDLELHTIELKKFSNRNEGLEGMVQKIKTSLDMWVAFLTRHDLLKNAPLSPSLDTPRLEKAMHVLEVMNFSQEERELYEDHLKWLRIEANTLKKYEAKGLEKGREQGREEGIKEGMEKGMENKALDIAKSMLADKEPIEKIIKWTGLSKQALEDIAKDS